MLKKKNIINNYFDEKQIVILKQLLQKTNKNFFYKLGLNTADGFCYIIIKDNIKNLKLKKIISMEPLNNVDKFTHIYKKQPIGKNINKIINSLDTLINSLINTLSEKIEFDNIIENMKQVNITDK